MQPLDNKAAAIAGQGLRLANLIPQTGMARTMVLTLCGLVIMLGLWQGLTWALDVPVYLVPAPSDVGRAVHADFALLASNAAPTIIEAFFGFLIGNVFAILVAISFVYNKMIEEMFYPIAIIIRTIPIVAIAPVLKIMLGNGMEPKIAVAAMICFFPTLVNAVRDFRAVNRQLLELMHVLSATKTETFRRVRIYSALPYIFSALKISVTRCSGRHCG